MLRERESAKICLDMLGSGHVKVVLGIASCALLLAGIASGAIAASPKPVAPTLTVKVAPTVVRPGQSYKITITGTYDKKAVHAQAYLIAFIQYSARACKPTAKQEAALPSSGRDWDFYPLKGIFVPPAFLRYDIWKAKQRLGTRDVCAYLYSQRVSLTSDTTPLVMASALFKNVKR
jgi:hypothetical protein